MKLFLVRAIFSTHKKNFGTPIFRSTLVILLITKQCCGAGPLSTDLCPHFPGGGYRYTAKICCNAKGLRVC